jgi:hypothetical protein
LKRAKGTDSQTIFDTEMEAIINFHRVTPPRENTPGIPTVGNQNPRPIPPTRPRATAAPTILTSDSTISNTTPLFYNASEAIPLVTES